MSLGAASERLRNDRRPEALDAVIAAAPGAADSEIATLAHVLANSGTRLPTNADAVDVASTGAPSSLSTLIVPLQLAASGFVVPKLGVPGRPAGGIDVLATVPGYRTTMSAHEVEIALARSRVVHVVAADFAPLDRELFARRQLVGAQASAELVIASLLSKKLAMGVTRAGLDIRVGVHGNFGTTWEAAEENAERFCSVARMLEFTAMCVLTDASLPYQPWIGRGEALRALSDVVQGVADPWLASHQEDCWRMASAACPAAKRVSVEELASVLALQLVAHETSLDAFAERVEYVRAAQVEVVSAKDSGFAAVDLGALRTALVAAQQESRETTPFPDSAGVRLLTRPDDPVEVGTPLAEVRGTAVNRVIRDQIGASIGVRPHGARPHALQFVST